MQEPETLKAISSQVQQLFHLLHSSFRNHLLPLIGETILDHRGVVLVRIDARNIHHLIYYDQQRVSPDTDTKAVVI
jgi:hypothetical protein